MILINCVKTLINNSNNQYGCFIIEPLELSHGITIGNTLRRIFLSELISYNIIGVRLNKLKHPFESIQGLKEDCFDLLANLKEIIFKSNNNLINTNILKGALIQKGPCILTAGMFKLFNKNINIINPNQYIGTLINNSDLYCEIDISNNNVLLTSNYNYKLNSLYKTTITLPLESTFNPIKRINFKIKIITNKFGQLKESLIFEIWTNGSITPHRSLYEVIKISSNLFTSLLLTPKILNFLNYLK